MTHALIISAASIATGYLLGKGPTNIKTAVLRLFGRIAAAGSAAAKLAEADTKIAVLTKATSAKKAEVDAVHAGLDEVHKLLG
jgi:hypothetical protein